MSTVLCVGDIPGSITWNLDEMGPLGLCVQEVLVPPLTFALCMTGVSVSWCKVERVMPPLPARVVENFQTKEVNALHLKAVTKGP